MSSRVLRLLISLWMRRDRARSVTFQTQELPVKRGSRICVSQSNALSLRVIQLCRPVRVVPVYSSLELSSGVSWVTDGLLFSVFSETQKQTQYFNTFISESRGCEAFSREFTHLETDRSEEKPRTSRPDWTAGVLLGQTQVYRQHRSMQRQYRHRRALSLTYHQLDLIEAVLSRREERTAVDTSVLSGTRAATRQERVKHMNDSEIMLANTHLQLRTNGSQQLIAAFSVPQRHE